MITQALRITYSLSFELVTGRQAQDCVLTVPCQTKGAAKASVKVVFKIGDEIDARVLLGLTPVESKTAH